VYSVYITGKNLEKFKFNPGQYLHVSFLTKGLWAPHPFSISQAHNGRTIRISVKNSGDHTSRINTLKAGTKVFLEGPFGRFTPAVAKTNKYLFIAGGIGYHFVVDENGQIYEGRQGGKFVVGGHAYCNNVGTIGIVLLGNFEIEQPSQKQAQSLQWLLSDLARKYNIDVNNSVQFHGKKFVSPIVRHRDLLSTL
jgi:hypothetical protein